MVKPVGSIGIVTTMAVSNGIYVVPLVKESKAHVKESSVSAPTSPSLLCGTIPIVFKLALLCKAATVNQQLV